MFCLYLSSRLLLGSFPEPLRQILNQPLKGWEIINWEMVQLSGALCIAFQYADTPLCGVPEGSGKGQPFQGTMMNAWELVCLQQCCLKQSNNASSKKNDHPNSEINLFWISVHAGCSFIISAWIKFIPVGRLLDAKSIRIWHCHSFSK